ncbi:MAG: ATPase component BioM of energizing module of biotin ECF transporter [uncultured Sulfurovum sp.]|uniref:ATPase component BioM of energizing module of biotin ECF transporter n=1 Tax=uncultured Sulfurovum sp. TaxID=269237 RepID=A0A6S6RY00_9BACT|nr:MAG: ATPase component BioM of energizing module of biotin ECF transporter [uncultured Sulfurovum sp.]
MLTNIRKLEKRILKEVPSDYKRYLYHAIDFNSQMIGIVGARGVGKTTLLLQYIKALKEEIDSYKSLYFSYDYPSNIEIKLIDLAEAFSKIGGEYLIIDEIHKYKAFAIDLKAVYDFYPKIKVIFTGSCAISIYNAQADLSRRVVLYGMNGLSYREFLELKLNVELPHYSLEELVEKSTQIVDELEDKFLPLEHFEEYLTYGYYPFYFRDQNQYLRLLNAVVNQTIDIDLVNLGLVKQSFTDKLKKLLMVISESNPFELNITKVATNIEVSRNTLYSYLTNLDKGGLLNIVGSSKKGISKLSKPEKLYLNNTNIFYIFANESKVGTIRETFFVSQVKHLYQLEVPAKGDFLVDGKYTFEVGGESKGFKQIEDVENAYLVIDTDSTENPNKIPLWLFGFLY